LTTSANNAHVLGEHASNLVAHELNHWFQSLKIFIVNYQMGACVGPFIWTV